MSEFGIGWYIAATAIIYLCLTVVTVVALREFSLRHTLFYLVMSVLGVWGSVLFLNVHAYVVMLLVWMAPAISLLILRRISSSGPRIWEAATFMAFAFAITQLALALTATVPPFCKSLLTFSLYIVINTPTLIFWGYYFTEHGWMNAMGGFALLQTHFSEVVSYLKSRISIRVIIYIAIFLIATGYLCVESQYMAWVPVHTTEHITKIVMFVLLNAGLLFRGRENLLSETYRETRAFAMQYENFNRNVEDRKRRIQNTLQFEKAKNSGIYVLVIGESANRGHMSAYGYSLETTPWLDSFKNNPQMFLFSNSYSCHCFTVPTLSYALTAKNQYNTMDLKDAVSLIEVANAAGYETAWLSTQSRYSAWNTPYSVIAEAAAQKIWFTDDFDMALVDAVDQLKITDRMLLVFHLMGSHLSYHDRYPNTFDHFHTLGRHPQYDEYDNSILYNDYVMQKLTEKVSALPNFQCMLYCSDHSVLVDEGHDIGFEQFAYGKTRIPFYIFASHKFQEERPKTFQRLQNARHEIVTNDLVFDALLGLMGDMSSVPGYNPENDITNELYNANPARFYTMHGKYAITNDPLLNR